MGEKAKRYTLTLTFEEHSGIIGDRVYIEDLTKADFLILFAAIQKQGWFE